MKTILIIYTGGTIGMKKDPNTGSLVPFDFSQIEKELPDLKKLDCEINILSFPKLIDSSDVQPPFWIKLAEAIRDNYSKYDGFVVLHGTDTMAYSASALSFMLENLSKPVIFTGSQLPIGLLRTDAKENLITAIEIASSGNVPEVCVYIQNRLLRGNRTVKFSTELFNAFESFNYKPLAEVGVYIKYNKTHILPISEKTLIVNTKLCMDIAILYIYPGISISSVDYILSNKSNKAVILRTFGSGNAPTSKEFLSVIEKAISRGLIVLNVTQCLSGSVEMEKYATGSGLSNIGVINGYDITVESAITKLALLLGKYENKNDIIKNLSESICGEITIPD